MNRGKYSAKTGYLLRCVVCRTRGQVGKLGEKEPKVNPASCVILVPVEGQIVPECAQALQTLERRGYQVRRIHRHSTLDQARGTIAQDALEAGFDELMWINSDIAFEPDDVEKLRRHNLPLACGIYPQVRSRELACAFLPGTDKVQFGQSGGLLEILYAAFGFVLTRRNVFEEIKRGRALTESNRPVGSSIEPWFMPLLVEDDANGAWDLPAEFAFCERARRCQFRIMADTSIRLWRIGSYAFSWEDAGSDKERYDDYIFHLPAQAAASAGQAATAAEPYPRATLPRNPLHEEARPLPPGFPRFKAYLVSYAANHESMQKTLESFRACDWGEDPLVLIQPPEWPIDTTSASGNYKRALEAALSDGCDFALFLEDDVRVNRWLRRNLSAIPLVQRDQCDYLSLFMPDLIASPWERHEPHLGYRLAKPLYSGPNRMWEKHRLWGSQACVLSRRFILAALERWDRLNAGQDTRLISVCSELRLPMWYSAPCLIQHAPLRSAFNTPAAYAADFDRNFVFAAGAGFQAPEEIPGWLTLEEGNLLWQQAAGCRVLELGTAAGRSTVCLGQQARRVVTVDRLDQAEAKEWVKRFGLSDRVEFRLGDVEENCRMLSGRFDLVFIDTDHDAAAVARDIEAALPLLEPGGRLAFHDYPDPGWPEVRRIVDEYAQRLGWHRLAQADYLGVFQS
jgi:predicted O-methyltransferase YrrM